MVTPLANITSSPPAPISVTTLKNNLSERLNAVIEHHQTYVSASTALQSLGIQVEGRYGWTYEYHVIEKATNAWIKEQCTATNDAIDNQTHVSFSHENLPDNISRIDLHSRDRIGDTPVESAPIDDVINHVIKTYPFDTLVNTLISAEADINQLGRKKAANDIADVFSLHETASLRSKHTLHIKSQKGRYLLPVEFSGSHNNIYHIPKLWNASETLGNDIDNMSLRQVTDDLMLAMRELRYDGMFPSRTKFSNDEAEITIFKEKCVFSFTPDLFESIVAFITQYGETDLRMISFV